MFYIAIILDNSRAKSNIKFLVALFSNMLEINVFSTNNEALGILDNLEATYWDWPIKANGVGTTLGYDGLIIRAVSSRYKYFFTYQIELQWEKEVVAEV